MKDTQEYKDGMADAQSGEPYTNPYPPSSVEYKRYHAGFWSVARQNVKAQA